MLDREQQTSLIWLQWHWGTRYAISVVDGTWTAYPASAPEQRFTAGSALDLRELMRNDHAARAAHGQRPR
jgi:hypothetical protein